ncbi:MAG: hypothetical protein AAGC64_04190 [Bacteroidota bacterium]
MKFPMKITAELLERYWNEECSEEECKAVESWLESTKTEPDQLDELQVSDSKNNVWNDLRKSIGKEEKTEEVLFNPSPHTYFKYAVACLLLLVLGAGYFIKYSGNSLYEFSSEEQSQLVLSIPEQDKVALVDQGCIVQFEGVLSLHNPTPSKKSIICNGKTYLLEAGEKYLIDSRYPNLQTSSMRVMREFIINDFVRTDYYSKSSFQLGTC